MAALGAWLLALAYPVVVYLGLRAGNGRAVLLGLLAFSLLYAWLRFDAARREVLVGLVPSVGAIAGLSVLGLLLRRASVVLALPVLINVGLLFVFGASLRAGAVPFVERFARLEEPNLTDEQRAYCRSVTKVWCAFFVLNGAAAGLLALKAPLAWWTLYTGLLAYVAMGTLFAVEYTYRAYRFRQYRGRLPDRILSAIFPPRS